MTQLSRPGPRLVLFLTMAAVAGGACSLKRPNTAATRMIEPQLPEQANSGTSAPNATPIRLLDTQARAHIGRRLLHQQPDGELTEDAIWRWSSAPDRYLDTALRLALASSPEFRLVDTGTASALAATLVVWDLEHATERRLVGAVEFQFTGTDRVVRTQLVKASEPISATLPGNLAVAAGQLFHRLASDGLTRVARAR